MRCRTKMRKHRFAVISPRSQVSICHRVSNDPVVIAPSHFSLSRPKRRAFVSLTRNLFPLAGSRSMPARRGHCQNRLAPLYEPAADRQTLADYSSWDTANKSGELNDYNVCTGQGVRSTKRIICWTVPQTAQIFPISRRESLGWPSEYSPAHDPRSRTRLPARN